MNVFEMHLAIQQGVDKINSLQADMLLSEEIDIELNKSLYKFISTKYGRNNQYQKGFEQSQKRIDDLRSLVKEFSGPATYKEQLTNTIWVDKFQLPSDYMYLVNQRSEVLHNDCSPVEWYFSNNDPTAYMIIPMTNFHDGTHFVDKMELIADPSNATLGQVDMLNSGIVFSSYTYPADLTNLRADIELSSNWGVGFEFYWEQYGDLDVPGCFIVIIDLGVHGWYNWDTAVPSSSATAPTQITTAVGQFATSTGLQDSNNTQAFAEYTQNGLGIKRIAGSGSFKDHALNKFIQQDDIYTLLNDPFNTTKHSSPLTTIRGRYLDIYTSDIFIIDKVKITYIRKPKNISLSLGIDCELPEHTHQEIVDMAVSSILEGIGDPRYKTQQVELNKNE